MLTTDLILASTRKGYVVPRYLDARAEENLELAKSLTDVFARHRGLRRRELQAELDEILGAGTQFMLHRGLAKLLFDRCDFGVEGDDDPIELRLRVFEKAAEAYRESDGTPLDVDTFTASVCESLELGPSAVDDGLYADLKEEQRLLKFDEASPEWLLDRYNVALAQGVLLRASRLSIEISNQSPMRYRELFRAIKFHRLLFSVTGDSHRGYRISLDGPLSLFKSSQRYGLQMAQFLPTLLKFDDWRLEAEVAWGKGRVDRKFRLEPKHKLRSHRDLKGQFRPEEIEWITTQLAKSTEEWSVSSDTPLLDLGGQGAFVPDFLFRHEPSGTEVFLEVFGFWRKVDAEARARLLLEHGPPNIILAVSKELCADKKVAAELPEDVYIFRHQPIAREILDYLKKFEPEESRTTKKKPASRKGARKKASKKKKAKKASKTEE
ncbi:MAG: DUF790 family protein [Planctomycetota bacterium]